GRPAAGSARTRRPPRRRRRARAGARATRDRAGAAAAAPPAPPPLRPPSPAAPAASAHDAPGGPAGWRHFRSDVSIPPPGAPGARTPAFRKKGFSKSLGGLGGHFGAPHHLECERAVGGGAFREAFLLDPALDAVAGDRVETVDEQHAVEVVDLVLE